MKQILAAEKGCSSDLESLALTSNSSLYAVFNDVMNW